MEINIFTNCIRCCIIDTQKKIHMSICEILSHLYIHVHVHAGKLHFVYRHIYIYIWRQLVRLTAMTQCNYPGAPNEFTSIFMTFFQMEWLFFGRQ